MPVRTAEARWQRSLQDGSGTMQVGSGAFLVRRGPDVERSPMAPLSALADRLRHPGLVKDFFAGMAVSARSD